MREQIEFIIVQNQNENNKYKIIQREYFYPKKWFIVYNCKTDKIQRVEYGKFIHKDILEISESIVQGKNKSNKFITAKRIGNVLLIGNEF